MICRVIGWRALPALALPYPSASMNTTQICPSCFSETRRLIYCTIHRRLVCAESCAQTDADLFRLELMQQNSEQPLVRGANEKAKNPLQN